MVVLQVYGPNSEERLRQQVHFNLKDLGTFLTQPTDLKLEIRIRLDFVLGEDPRHLNPIFYMALVSCIYSMKTRGNFEIHLVTHPRYMDLWVDTLVRIPKVQDAWVR